jgi:hypothetical protein
MSRLFGAVLVAVALASLTPPCRADIIRYGVVLNGPSESPPQPSPGTGLAEVDVDTVANTLHVQVTFSGLLGTTSASHIHSPTAAPFTGTAGVATTSPTFPNFPLGVTSGSYDMTFNLLQSTTYNAPFLAANGNSPAAAEAALLASFASGTSYLNIHTSFAPGGEIRGFLTPLGPGQIPGVPEPSSLALFFVDGTRRGRYAPGGRATPALRDRAKHGTEKQAEGEVTCTRDGGSGS